MVGASESHAQRSTAWLLLSLVICHVGAAYAAGVPVHLSAIYVVGQLFTVTLAVFCKSRVRAVRWVAGVACTVVLAGFKTAALMPALGRDIGLGGKMLAYGTSALWESSNAALVFGGELLQSSSQISSYRRALVAGLIPCQLKFVERSQPGRTSWRCAHLMIWFLCGVLLRETLRSSAALENVVAASPILEAEAMAALMSVAVLVHNLPAIFCQITMDVLLRIRPDNADFRVFVILPYGAVLLSRCSRDFWRRWSRPATQLIRQMLYHPLGGPDRPWLSIPLMFAINATAHYDVSKVLVGDRAETAWNVVFGVLGCAALMETYAVRRLRSSGAICTVRRCSRAEHENDEGVAGAMTERNDADAPDSLHEGENVGPPHAEGSDVAPREVKLFFFVATHASLVFAAYILLTRCLKLSLRSFL